jgi:hypothetical protein
MTEISLFIWQKGDKDTIIDDRYDFIGCYLQQDQHKLKRNILLLKSTRSLEIEKPRCVFIIP